MTNQELSKVAQAAAYVDVLVNAGIIDNETENFCINKVKQLLDELLKEENKIQLTCGPTYRNYVLDTTVGGPLVDKVSITNGPHPGLTNTTTTARNM